MKIATDITIQLRCAGHILGAATVEVIAGGQTLVFSGDLGRPDDPLMFAPEAVEQADYLLVESTYGDRQHPDESPQAQLAEVITRTALRRGITLVPSFAVGRAQLLMYHLYQLKRKRAIPDIPIYLNSPMATDVTILYQRFRSEHRLSMEDCEGMCHVAQFVHSVDDSRALDQQRTPAVIIAASGMATGGRVVHHLKALAPNPINTLLMPGFQAGGTRGAQIVAGAPSVRIHGRKCRSGLRSCRWKPCPHTPTPMKSCSGCVGSNDLQNIPLSFTVNPTRRTCYGGASAWSWGGRFQCRSIAIALNSPVLISLQAHQGSQKSHRRLRHCSLAGQEEGARLHMGRFRSNDTFWLAALF